jgi:hypothetical protein
MNRSTKAAIEQGLASSNLEEVYDAILDIGKHGYRDMAERVVPYLASATAFLREAALRTLVFHFHLPAHKADAIRLLASDPDEGVRQVAAMGLRVFAQTDRELLQHLVNVSLDESEDESVRESAFIAALVAAGLERANFPMERWLPEFETKANWALLATVLHRASMPITPALARRLASQPADVPLTGDAARAFMDEVGAQARRQRADRLAAAKADAARRGKEPFDLAKLETMCDTTHEGRLDPVEDRHAEFERKYYVHFPNVMTLAEFARTVEELNRWS